MIILTHVIIGLVALLHIYFLILEMVLWQKPFGLKNFRMSAEKAATTAVLAANQGLYNGFLAGGLLTSYFLSSELAYAFRLYFLICIVIAGLYGGKSANPKIYFVQALPAFIALILVLIIK